MSETALARRAAAWPALMLGLFFAVPFGIMLAVSFFERIQGGFFEPGFEATHYLRFLDSFFLEALAFSLGISGLAAAVCIAVAFPFTYLLSLMGRRAQVAWLVLLLSILSLSEVIIGFSWSQLLSRTAGVGNLLVHLGLETRAPRFAPGFGAVLTGLCYLGFPYAALTLYPAVSRLDPTLAEAARMLGASPLRAFFGVVVPAMRRPIAAAFVLVFVFTLGAYLIPQLLGRPQHWTLPVLIADQALFQSNMPFAAAMGIFLMGVSLGLVAIVGLIGRGR